MVDDEARSSRQDRQEEKIQETYSQSKGPGIMEAEVWKRKCMKMIGKVKIGNGNNKQERKERGIIDFDVLSHHPAFWQNTFYHNYYSD